MTRKLTTLLVIVLVAKLLAVVAGSYPFDFASFVYQARSFFEYGIHPLFFWNKGLPLLGLFYGQYSLYQFIIGHFFHSTENTILLHLFFKIIFFACDLITAYFISRIIHHLTRKPDLSLYGALIWLCNPFLLWSIELHGSYAIVAVLFTTISLLLFLQKRYISSVILLGLGTSVYYYAAIFLPFYILKRAYESKEKPLLHATEVTLVFIATITICYLPYFFEPQFARDLIASLANHSAPNASPFAAAIQLPTYSLIKFPYYFFAHYYPTNRNAPELFKIAGFITFLGLLLIALLALKSSRLYFKRKVYSLYTRRKVYDDQRFIFDQLIAVTIFLLLIGNLQDHYLVWVYPFMIIAVFVYGKQFMFRNLLLISFTALFIVFCTNNFGVYLLDIIPFGTVDVYIPQPPIVLTIFGFLLMVMLGSNLFVNLQKNLRTNSIIEHNSGWIIMPVAFSVLIGGISLFALISATSLHSATELGSDSNVYNFAYSPLQVHQSSPNTTYQNIPIADANFSAEHTGEISQNQFINPGKSPWYFYNYQGAGQHILSIANINGVNAMTITPGSAQHAIQVNLGHGSTISNIAVNPYNKYSFSVKVQNNGLDPSLYKASIRFRDHFGNIISGSDLKLEPSKQSNENNWVTYSTNFTAQPNAAFLEPLLTVNVPTNVSILPAANVRFTDFSLSNNRTYVTITYDQLASASNNATINKYVLTPPTNRYFHFIVRIPRDDFTEYLQQVTLNKCTQHNITFNEEYFDFETQFSPSCYIKSAANNLTFTTINYPQQPHAQISLVHISSHQSVVIYHSKVYATFTIVGAILTATLILLAVWGIRKL